MSDLGDSFPAAPNHYWGHPRVVTPPQHLDPAEPLSAELLGLAPPLDDSDPPGLSPLPHCAAGGRQSHLPEAGGITRQQAACQSVDLGLHPLPVESTQCRAALLDDSLGKRHSSPLLDEFSSQFLLPVPADCTSAPIHPPTGHLWPSPACCVQPCERLCLPFAAFCRDVLLHRAPLVWRLGTCFPHRWLQPLAPAGHTTGPHALAGPNEHTLSPCDLALPAWLALCFPDTHHGFGHCHPERCLPSNAAPRMPQRDTGSRGLSLGELLGQLAQAVDGTDKIQAGECGIQPAWCDCEISLDNGFSPGIPFGPI